MVFGLDSSLVDSETISVYTLEILTDTELVKSVEHLKKKVRNLRLENEVLEASIVRLQPSLMAGTYSALEFALKWSQSQNQRTGSGVTIGSVSDNLRLPSYPTVKSRSSMFYRKLDPSVRGIQSSVKLSRSIIINAGPKVNVEEKLELVYALMEKEGKDLKKYRKFAKKQEDYVNAQLEEIDLRSENIDTWTVAFKQEVVIEGVDPVTKRIPAETWIRFMTEQGKKIDRQITKMRIRISNANVQHRKLREDIKVKKDLSERLLPVDFEVKTVEIKNALEKIDRKNIELIGLKALTGDANLNLTRYRNDMMTITNYLQKVRKLTSLRKHQTVKVKAESDALAAEVEIYKQRLDKIQKSRYKYLVPDVMDYVRVKYKQDVLKSSIKRLETSLNIKRLALRHFIKEKRKSLELFSKVL